MILFYSNHCSSCQMLLDQINRYNKKSLFKLVNVERVLSKGLKLPKDVQSVPTLLINNTYINGKKLFDYLLLPNRGILFATEAKNTQENTTSNTQMNNNDPMAFGFSQSSTSEIYAFIEDDDNSELHSHKATNWSSINDNISIVTPSEDTKSGSSSKKNSIPDISTLRQEREMELQNHLNNTALPPVSNH